MPENKEASALFVDLDGTLVASDVTEESALSLIRKNPLYVFRMPFWICKGFAYFKKQVATRVDFDVTHLPYHKTFLTYLEEQKRGGRRLVLATASDEIIADKVASHLKIFDKIIASDGLKNRKGSAKLEAMKEDAGVQPFGYAGNSRADLAIWKESPSAIVVNASDGLIRRVEKITTVEQIFPKKPWSFKSVLASLRLHQWAKNLLIFIPAIMAHRFREEGILAASLLAFLSFGLMASAFYVLNDLFDLASDRAHPGKASRPFASGELSLRWGVVMFPVLFLASTLVGAFLPIHFLLILGLYFVVNAAYSFFIKQIPILDVLVLAGLYSLRILAGSWVTGIQVSPWLLAFSMFLFVSLAFVKRVSEISALGESLSVKKRGYRQADLQQLENFGVTSGYLSVLVMVFYINSESVVSLYHRPLVLWFVCPVILYWISRVWLLTHRGEMHEDPIVFAIWDKLSYVVGVAVLFLLYAAGPK